MFFLFFKQKTAYEMRISDWSSDVCSSDLSGRQRCELRRFGDASQTTELGVQARALRQQGDDFARQSPFDRHQLRCRDRKERLPFFDGLSLHNMKIRDDTALAVLNRLTTDRKSTRLNSSH